MGVGEERTSCQMWKGFDERQLQKKWSNLQERLKTKIRQRNATGGGTSANLNSRDEITHRILGECNPTLTMIPGAWPPAPSDRQSGTTSSGESNDPDPLQTPTTPVPSAPVLPSVDCTSRKRQRTEKTPQQILVHPDDDSADPILQEAKRAYYEAGAAYFHEASRYYARMNEDIKKYDEQVVMDSVYASLDSDDDFTTQQNSS